MGLTKTWTAFADRFVPPSLRSSPGSVLRARLLVLYAAVTLLTCPVFMTLYAVDGLVAHAVVVAVAIVLGVLVPFVLRATESLVITGNFATGVFFGANFVLGMLTGGLDIGTFPWLGACALFATFLAGLRWGLLWLVVSALGIVAMTVLHQAGALPQADHPMPPWFEAFSAVVLSSMLFAFAAIYEDMKERAVASVEVARVKAEEASRAKGELLATLSHEIRTPLNGILGMSEVLLLGELPAEARRRVEVVRGSGAGLLRVVNDVLELSRLEATSADVRVAPFDPCALVDDVARLFAPTAEARGLSLDVARAPTCAGLRVQGDSEKIRQVLANLVNNAVKYTEQGGVRVIVEAEQPSAQGRVRLRFHVEDTGPGIPAHEHQLIFEPFRRTSSTPDGTGLGLAISRRLATLMGGSLDVASVAGLGARFTLSLDLHGTVSEPPRAAHDAPGLARPARVLVVEDNPVNREVAAIMLKSRGMHVELADEGGAALEALQGGAFDLVLMDCQMPGLDGLATTREIRRRESGARHTPIVAMTAAALAGDRERCLDAGMDDYLTKPVTLEALDDVIARHLRA